MTYEQYRTATVQAGEHPDGWLVGIEAQGLMLVDHATAASFSAFRAHQTRWPSEDPRAWAHIVPKVIDLAPEG
jgi:hypothetical protein